MTSYDRDSKEFPACETCNTVPNVGEGTALEDGQGNIIEYICNKCLGKRNKDEKQEKNRQETDL